MRRRLIAAALGLALAGCSNGQFNPIVVAAVDEILPGERGAEPKAPPVPLTRAALTRADVAAIQVRLVDDPSRAQTLLFAASDNGGYVTFSSALRQNFTLRGSWITGTRGIGWDLLSAASSRPDPLVTPMPVGSWPRQVERTYEFSAFAPQGRIETFTCTYEFGERQEIVIVEDRHVGVVVSETCAGESGSFENLHLADAQTGFVWRSLQWLGPQQGLVELRIVVPYTGRRS